MGLVSVDSKADKRILFTSLKCYLRKCRQVPTNKPTHAKIIFGETSKNASHKFITVSIGFE